MSTKHGGAAAQPPDPFAPEALRIPQNYTELGVKKLLVNIPVKRPNRQAFVRTHRDLYLETLVVELKEERETYLVVGDARIVLAEEAVAMVLRLSITRQGTPFYWPIRMPGPDGRLDSWNSSAMQAAKAAEDQWVSVKANRSAGGYDVLVATADIPEPRWEEVLDGRNQTDLLRIAFRGRVIDTDDHPVVKQLLGLP